MRTREQIEADIKSTQEAIASYGRVAEYDDEDSRIAGGMFYDNCYRRIAELRRELEAPPVAPAADK
jgi:hypothetical protein